MKSFLFLIILFLSFNSDAQVSAVREKNQDYRDIANSHFKKRALEDTQFIQDKTAYGLRQSKVDTDKVSEWKIGDINEGFKIIRDERFMTDASEFQRRPTWLYPKDGCYARAELSAQRLIKKGFSAPSKIFIFGNLEVQTNNAFDGMVDWWYHVAVAYRHKGTVYVMDPAIEPKKMLTADEWAATMGKDSKEFSICAEGAIDPESSCTDKTVVIYESAVNLQTRFFGKEWKNLEMLGRNPQEELGDNPPWSK